MFDIDWTEAALEHYGDLENDPAKIGVLKAVSKALEYLEANPRHKSLQTHEYHTMKGPAGEKIFEAYAQNQTPGAYRIFFYYGPNEKDRKGTITRHVITLVAITPHL